MYEKASAMCILFKRKKGICTFIYMRIYCAHSVALYKSYHELLTMHIFYNTYTVSGLVTYAYRKNGISTPISFKKRKTYSRHFSNFRTRHLGYGFYSFLRILLSNNTENVLWIEISGYMYSRCRVHAYIYI